MRKIRYGFIVLGMLLCLETSATAGVSVGIGIGLPNVSIGINLPLFPELVPVPGYPVYYAPGIDGNYFFYDGMYWVYQNDNWYASSWYNGPWGFVDPAVVPLFVLRVPVSYYRQPPVYFGGWQRDRAPRWGDHWGRSWQQRRSGWDRWNRTAAPARAPIPVYQRQYAGDRYPQVEQQKTLRSQQYRYQPRDKVVRQHLKQVEQKAPATQPVRAERPQTRAPQERQHSAPQQQGVPAGHAQPVNSPAKAQPQQQRGPAAHEQRQQQPAAQREQHAPQGRQGKGQGQEQQERGGGQGQDRGHGQGQNKDEGRGR
ncbi:MAG TPA: hypothetical protein DCZ75_13875 [Geobacter sp.]|nr:hypothetical protein [Geobacter sp.]